MHDTRLDASSPKGHAREVPMLYYALVFLLVAVIAGVFGFGGISLAAAGIAKVLFFVFLVAFIASAVMAFARRGHAT